MEYHISLPLTDRDIENLASGDYVYLSGTIYTARDAAHKRIFDYYSEHHMLPIDLKGQVIYYLGPTPAKEGQIIGSAGPTTSSRMDKYTPLLLEHGLKGMIGKGIRSQEVVQSMIKNKAVYFAAVGGAGALLSKKIHKCEIVCYEDLGAEAVYRLEVVEFPVIVVIDKMGNNLYASRER